MPGGLPRLGQAEYKHLIVEASPKALAVKPGQFFNLLCPSPDVGELCSAARKASIASTARRAASSSSTSASAAAPGAGARSCRATALNMVGPARRGLSLDPPCRNIVVLGRGVGLATLGADLAACAARTGSVSPRSCPRAAPISSWPANSSREVGDVISVLDNDGSSAVENVEAILERLIAEGAPMRSSPAARTGCCNW